MSGSFTDHNPSIFTVELSPPVCCSISSRKICFVSLFSKRQTVLREPANKDVHQNLQNKSIDIPDLLNTMGSLGCGCNLAFEGMRKHNETPLLEAADPMEAPSEAAFGLPDLLA